MKSATLDPLSLELLALQRMKDEEIDLSDIPEILDWSDAVIGKFFRPGSRTR